jgi:transposase-like protein
MSLITSGSACPKCGGRMLLEDKNTFSGRDIREFRCQSCRCLVEEDYGIALWQVLHDANQQESVQAQPKAKSPWWKFWAK